MWEETKLENFVTENLPAKIGGGDAETILSEYKTARAAVVDYVLPEIKASEPHLSDHGPKHIKDVFENVWQLVEDQKNCPVEMLVLCICVLYHDVGNVFGRDGHHKRIAKVFNETFPKTSVQKSKLRTLVINIAGAHTGDAADGSKDTLKSLNDDDIFKTDIRSQELGAVLRLADELAEGPHRTSSFRLDNGLYDAKSTKFHIYAACCSPAHIVKKRNKITLRYQIPLKRINDTDFSTFHGDLDLDILLNFIYQRVIKLDQERKYCRHYSEMYLKELRETSVVFEFWLDNEDQIEFTRPPLVLDDLIVPGSDARSVVEQYPEYSVELIINDLLERISN